ncbi:hypothetical protein AVEN_129068-1 [Araneus ventricosus]|uniref:Uncharacterized protein n=1 Tax=Araneus ventricosus TaxID=182803 RepID=A0A4Y2SDP2_ARAVE|nr:hypothetical protein AVEN_129068-1 [Araneus ventricosus]
MTRTTPELAPPSPNFRATPTGGRLATTYDLACNRPHTRRIFGGIGSRTCDPPVTRLEEIKEYGEEAVWDDFVKVTSDILGKPLPSTELKRCDLACLALIMMGSAVKICR